MLHAVSSPLGSTGTAFVQFDVKIQNHGEKTSMGHLLTVHFDRSVTLCRDLEMTVSV
jgi:hypothetical protein